ncbi:TPA: hypothetical protein ACKOP2_004109 [Clostridioides difficile]
MPSNQQILGLMPVAIILVLAIIGAVTVLIWSFKLSSKLVKILKYD